MRDQSRQYFDPWMRLSNLECHATMLDGTNYVTCYRSDATTMSPRTRVLPLCVMVLLSLISAANGDAFCISAGTMSCYDVLEIDRDADISSVRKAYRKLSLRYHPDKESGSPDHFLRISEAYEVCEANHCGLEGFGLHSDFEQ